MKNTYDYYSLMDEGAKSMAEMFRDIDGLLKMNFDCEGSISETYYIPDILKSEFNYASGGTYQILSIEDAQPLVTSEILAGRPVIMDGYNTHTIKTTGKLFWKKNKDVYDDGHCWVCDGYKQLIYETVLYYLNKKQSPLTKYSYQIFYHMNWGWSGIGMREFDNDGWFSFSNIEIYDPEGLDDPNDKTNYQYKRGYLTGIKAK